MIFAAAQIKSNFYLFADDSNLPYADKNLKSFDTEVVNTELHNLYIFQQINSHNMNKSSFVIFCPCLKKLIFQSILSIFDKGS